MSKLFGKKLLCGLLAFALVLGYIPGTVFAAEAEETEVTIAPIEVQADTLNVSYVDGGLCGYFSNVSWSLYSDGTLIFSGTGEMAINKEESAPWLRYASDIISVVIESGVTDIEDFEDCVNLTSVSIADTVTQIWGAAFRGCTSLPGITIPDHVTYIGGAAFSGCTSLTSIRIPASVVDIGESAFASCDSLTGIWVDEGNQNYASDASGVLFNKEKITLLQAPGGIKGTYSVPDSVTTIGASAFKGCTSLTGVTIPSSVTSIGSYAFYDCKSLTDVTIPYRVTTIDRFTFSGCTSLSAITIPMSVTEIKEGAFAGCTSLKTITIPSSVTSIGYSAFQGCASLTDVTIPLAVKTIESATFSGCASLKTITIPMGVTEIEGGAFASCGALTEITFLGSAPEIEAGSTWDTPAFSGVTATAYYPADDASWTEDKMQDYGGTITWKASVVDGPGNVIAEGTCGENLIWTLTETGKLTISGTGAMTDYSYMNLAPWSGLVRSVKIHAGVTHIGDYAFYDCSGLSSITLPDSVTSIGQYAFYNTGYYNNSENWENSALYLGHFILELKTEYSGSFLVKDGTKYIADYAFSFCDGLTNIILPDSIVSIGDYAFNYCKRLSSITIPEDVTSIGDNAFYICKKLTQITFVGNAPAFGRNVFDGVTATAYYPGDDATWTGDVMQDYGGTITWKAKEVSVIDSGACGENLTWTLTNLGKLTISGTGAMTDFGAEEAPWYYWRYDIKRVVVETGVTSIGNQAFVRCGSMTKITIPNSVTSIGESAFEGCTSLTSITIPDGVTSIGAGMFMYCSSLTDIAIPDGVTSIGDYAFQNCGSLTEITFMGNAPAIGEDAFGEVTATAYYPAGNSTWTADVMQNYGGTITWKAVCSNHQWGKWTVTTDPTCTKTGEETRTCGLCGEIETRSLDALGHKTALQNAKDATCTDDGYTGDEICAVCGETIKKGETIAAPGHDYQSVVTDPTCTEKGYTTHTCTRCGDSKVDTYVDALGHKTVLQNAKDVTCTEDGYTGDEICAVCGEIVKKGETIAALGHSFGQWTATTEPTCTEKGEEARTCSVCGETEKREVAALGHKLTLAAGKEAGFTEPGMKEHYVCEVCGKLFEGEAGTTEVTEEELVIPQLIQVVDGNVEISEEAVDKAIEIVENGGEIRIPVSDAGQVNSVTMPAKALSKVAELDASLTVEMTAATVTMDTAALETVAQAFGEDDVVTLKIAQIPTEYLTEEQQEAVKDKNVVGAISAQLLVNDQPIGSEASGGFGGGRVTVQIPFTPDQGTTAEDYKVLYVAADGSITEIPIAYEDGCLVMVVNHFSEYVIVKTKTVMLGDVNGDGNINIMDLMRLANFFAGKAEINRDNADVNGDGNVNIMDLMRLANYFAGKAELG